MKKCPTCKETYPGDFAVCPRDGTTLVEGGAWTEGMLVRGKYRILSKLGQGGMGAVYKAQHVAFDEMRALKVMNPELVSDEMFVKRFKHEAVITRKLQHPNAVRVDDIDETEDGRPFIVMEYIEGQSLKKVMQEQGPMPVPRVCSIIKQAAAGLEAAHRLGMVHRDIKPDNIALIETLEGEVAKVLDFGIAKIKEARADDSAGSGLTGTGVIIGTPQYMSPEQAMGKRGDDLDGRSDLYSLGVVMYQMLAGELPFQADTAMDMLLAHLQKQPPPLQKVRPEAGIPDGVASLVAKLLEKKPEARLPSASALIEEINKVEGQAPALGPTRVMKAVDLAAVEAAQAPPVSAPGPSPKAQPPAAVEPAERRPPTPVHVSPPPAPGPARKSSPWPLWAGVGVLVIALGGGGVWYKFIRQTGTAPPANPTSPSGNPEAQGNAGSATPAQSTGSPASSGSGSQSPPQPTGTAPTQAQTQQTDISGGTGGDPATSTPSAPPAAQPADRRVRRAVFDWGDSKAVKERPKSTTPPKKAVDTQKILAEGKILLDGGKYDEAIAKYQEGLKVEPRNATLLKAVKDAQRAKAAEAGLR